METSREWFQLYQMYTNVVQCPRQRVVSLLPSGGYQATSSIALDFRKSSLCSHTTLDTQIEPSEMHFHTGGKLARPAQYFQKLLFLLVISWVL